MSANRWWFIIPEGFKERLSKGETPYRIFFYPSKKDMEGKKGYIEFRNEEQFLAFALAYKMDMNPITKNSDWPETTLDKELSRYSFSIPRNS